MNSIIKKEISGLTIIELMIAMAIMLIIMAISYNFLFLNYRAYDTGKNLAEVQFDVRMAADIVSNELRNVKEISFDESNIDSPDQIDISSLNSQYASVIDAEFEIVKEGAGYVLVFEVIGNNTNLENDYGLRSRVLLNNISNLDNDTFDEANPIDSSVVYYKHFD